MENNIVKKTSFKNSNQNNNEDSLNNSNLSNSSSFDNSSSSSNNYEINKETNNNQTQNNNQSQKNNQTNNNQSVFSKERRSSLLHLISLYSNGTMNGKLHLHKQKKGKRNEKRNNVKKYKFTKIFFPKNDLEKEIFYTYEKIQNNFNPEEILTPKILFDYVKYIVTKNFYNQFDIYFLKLYLKKIQGLTNLFNENENVYIDEILQKISLFLKIENHPQNTIICFNGEIGENFYMIFEGEVSVLIPRPYKSFMNEKEYTLHLNNLYNLNEYDLLLRTIESNLQIFKNSSVLKYILEDFNLYNIPKDFEINVEDYINRVKPENFNEKNENKNLSKNYYLKKKSKREVELWGYFEVIKLNSGKTFGDVALSKQNINRTATIITTKDTIFGIIDKNSYNLSLMEVQERKRKYNIESLLCQKIFNEINPNLFGKHYFNYFKNLKTKKGDFLFKQGEKSKEIFFIHKGEIEIFCSNTYNGINNIINKLSNNSNNEDKEILKLIKVNENIKKIYMYDKKLFKIFITFNTEIVGLCDNYLNEYYFCDAKVISNEVSYFSIEKNLFKKIIYDDSKTEKKYNEYIKHKINFMIFRLIEIKNKKFFCDFDIIKNNKDNNNYTIQTEEQIESYNTFRKKTILNKKNIVLKSENNLIKLNSNDLNLFKIRLRNHNSNKISQQNLLKNNTTTFDSSNLSNYRKNLSNNSFYKIESNKNNIIRLIKKKINIIDDDKKNVSLPKVLNNRINLKSFNFIIKKKSNEKKISLHKLMLSKNIPINKKKIEEMRQKKLIIDKILNNKNSLENKGKSYSENIINCLAMDDFCKTLNIENNNNKEKNLLKHKILTRKKIKVLINNNNNNSNQFVYNSTFI